MTDSTALVESRRFGMRRIPLLLDRPVGVLAAVLTRWRVVQAQPPPMAQ